MIELKIKNFLEIKFEDETEITNFCKGDLLWPGLPDPYPGVELDEIVLQKVGPFQMKIIGTLPVEYQSKLKPGDDFFINGKKFFVLRTGLTNRIFTIEARHHETFITIGKTK